MTIYSVFSHSKMPFSIAMLNYQRVKPMDFFRGGFYQLPREIDLSCSAQLPPSMPWCGHPNQTWRHLLDGRNGGFQGPQMMAPSAKSRIDVGLWWINGFNHGIYGHLWVSSEDVWMCPTNPDVLFHASGTFKLRDGVATCEPGSIASPATSYRFMTLSSARCWNHFNTFGWERCCFCAGRDFVLG